VEVSFGISCARFAVMGVLSCRWLAKLGNPHLVVISMKLMAASSNNSNNPVFAVYSRELGPAPAVS
jgi:hypothetical protein